MTKAGIRLRLFPFSLRDKTKSWLISLPTGSMITCDKMAQKSLAKYVSREKIKNERGDYFLYQEESESLHQAWERHKELLRVCPYYGLPGCKYKFFIIGWIQVLIRWWMPCLEVFSWRSHLKKPLS